MKFVVVLLTLLTLGCGYGSMHNYGTMAASNAQVMQVVPAAVSAGAPSFMLTVNGSGFSMNSVVYWNGMPLSTKFLTSNQLVASVPASLVASPETVQVYVNSNGAASNTMNVTVN
jgi:trimeric autotransporter adhesin